jgi:transposase
VGERFGRSCCRETLRAALHRLGLSWKKAKKLLGRADPQRRQAFVEQIQDLLAGAQHDRHLLVYLDEAHIHQDADLGYGWSERGQRLWIASPSPRLSDKLSFYGLYLYNEGEVRLWPYARANGAHTVDVRRRLRAEWPEGKLIVVWDGASYHRAGAVREAATALHIDLVPLPGYSPDFMPVEALWRCSARMSPIITAIPPPKISAGGWLLSRPASIRTPTPLPTASGSKITSTLTKKNYASHGRSGLAGAVVRWPPSCQRSRTTYAVITSFIEAKWKRVVYAARKRLSYD